MVTDGMTLDDFARLVTLEEHCIEFRYVGSRDCCNPPVLDTDIDILYLVASREQFISICEDIGFKRGGSRTPKGQFSSLRCGIVNLIVTADHSYYEKFLIAHSIAKRLNILNKDDRVDVFRAVVDGKPCEERDPLW